MSTGKTLKSVAEIEALGFRRHHAATRRGYTPVVARGFGTPYKSSTQYEDIAYYVK